MASLPFRVQTVAAHSVMVGSRKLTLFERVFTLRLGPVFIARRRPWAVSVVENGQATSRRIPDVTRLAQAGILLAALLFHWALQRASRR